MHENVNFNKWDVALTDVELPFAVAVKRLYVLVVKLKTVCEWKLAKTTQIMNVHGWPRMSGLRFRSQFTYRGKICMGKDYTAKSARVIAFVDRFSH